VEEIAEVYARSLFEVAKERDVLDDVHEQLGQFADAVNDNRDVAVFLFSPYFSSEEKKEGLKRMISGADPAFANFLEALVERHRMPAIFRIRARFEEMWDQEKQLLPVEVTSAVELGESTVKSIGDRIGEQTDTTIELTTVVDPEILGGIVLRVGNFILDASIRNRLEQLRKQVAQA
jgi:F-type H+-transporting ATPase subunit delta